MTKKKTMRNRALFLAAILLAALFGFGLYHLFLGPAEDGGYVVSGSSMEPEYEHGDRIIIHQSDSDPAIGDVVLVHPSEEWEEITSNISLLKRITATPYDVIVITEENELFINDEHVWDLSYECDQTSEEAFEYTLGEDEYFVTGDNHTTSFDSLRYLCQYADEDTSDAFVSSESFVEYGEAEITRRPFGGLL